MSASLHIPRFRSHFLAPCVTGAPEEPTRGEGEVGGSKNTCQVAIVIVAVTAAIGSESANYAIGQVGKSAWVGAYYI